MKVPEAPAAPSSTAPPSQEKATGANGATQPSASNDKSSGSDNKPSDNKPSASNQNAKTQQKPEQPARYWDWILFLSILGFAVWGTFFGRDSMRDLGDSCQSSDKDVYDCLGAWFENVSLLGFSQIPAGLVLWISSYA
ncbi:hypothetical protein K461DRAFT_95959 [Myriangium duriaei CBS 260.36]|uniref:Uncharacterized protein n=1 Tax=Myriangium duriaei CBS 260.36 TaxID=1168546 RepID=A0A9P4MIX0_9PEZI|nr:hypothetical protein K461DRAFT_95959 [Myriangium duriaei CBS 260.36]